MWIAPDGGTLVATTSWGQRRRSKYFLQCIANKEDVPCTEKVGPDESIKVRAREGVHFVPCAVEAGSDWSLMVILVGVKVDEAHC